MLRCPSSLHGASIVRAVNPAHAHAQSLHCIDQGSQDNGSVCRYRFAHPILVESLAFVVPAWLDDYIQPGYQLTPMETNSSLVDLGAEALNVALTIKVQQLYGPKNSAAVAGFIVQPFRMMRCSPIIHDCIPQAMLTYQLGMAILVPVMTAVRQSVM